jgi:hypothetical protein
MSYISAAIAQLGLFPAAASQSRPVPAPRPDAARDCPEIARSLTLLRQTRADVSLFRITLDGPAAGEVEPLMRALLADDGVVERLGDGSWLVLVMRFDEAPEAVAERLAGALRVCLHRQGARLQATARWAALHRSANLIGDAGDLIDELVGYAPVPV